MTGLADSNPSKRPMSIEQRPDDAHPGEQADDDTSGLPPVTPRPRANLRRRWRLLTRTPGMARFYGVRAASRWVYERVLLGRPVSRD